MIVTPLRRSFDEIMSLQLYGLKPNWTFGAGPQTCDVLPMLIEDQQQRKRAIRRFGKGTRERPNCNRSDGAAEHRTDRRITRQSRSDEPSAERKEPGRPAHREDGTEGRRNALTAAKAQPRRKTVAEYGTGRNDCGENLLAWRKALDIQMLLEEP